MKKIIAFVITILALTSLCACDGGNEPQQETTTAAQAVTVAELTNDNVKAQMAILMPQAEKIYSYLMLGGLDVGTYDYDKAIVDSENGCRYTPVVDESLNTVAKVKALCETYYTKTYCESALYDVFGGTYPLYKEFDGVLCLNVDGGGGGGDTYVTETSQILTQNGDTVVVSMDCRDSYDGRYIAYVTLKLADGAYRIDAIQTTEV